MKKSQILYSNTNQQITEVLRNSTAPEAGAREASDQNQVILYNNNNVVGEPVRVKDIFGPRASKFTNKEEIVNKVASSNSRVKG